MHVALRGNLEPSDMQQILAIADAVIARHGRYGGVLDVRELATVTQGARRVAGQWPGSKACYGNCFFGASFAVRTLVLMMSRGLQLFATTKIYIDFFKSEPEARAALFAHRARVAQG